MGHSKQRPQTIKEPSWASGLQKTIVVSQNIRSIQFHTQMVGDCSLPMSLPFGVAVLEQSQGLERTHVFMNPPTAEMRASLF